MLWRVLTVTLSVRDAETRGKARTHAWRNQTPQTKFCNRLTEDQCIQLATPSFKLKKEKCEAKKMEASSTPSKDSSFLVDPATVSVIGAVNEQGSVSVYAQTCVNLLQNQAIYAHIIYQGVRLTQKYL